MNKRALEVTFPSVEVSRVSEQESWRKEINRPIYHIHKWWATRLGTVFRAINLYALSRENETSWADFYSKKHFGDQVVLDPFMGSGTTIGEALKLGAKVVGCDINPVSTFLVNQAFTNVREDELREAFRVLEVNVSDRIRSKYITKSAKTGKEIPVLYYFWVSLAHCPDGETVPLFSRYVFSQNAYPAKKPLAQIVCPKCWGVFSGRYDSIAEDCTKCGNNFNPQIGPAVGQTVTTELGNSYRIKELIALAKVPFEQRMFACIAVESDGTKVYQSITEFDENLYKEAERELAESELPLPSMSIRSGHNTDQARGYNYLHWAQLFNKRQLLSLGILLKEIQLIVDKEIRNQFLCLFSGTLEFNNLFCSFKGEGTGAVRHMFSNHILKPERTPLENSVWGNSQSSGTFSTLFESRLIPAKKYLDAPFEVKLEDDLFGKKLGSSKVVASSPLVVQRFDTFSELQTSSNGMMVLNGDSSRLPLPDGCIDAIVTDPPYFDFVHYSELSDFFFAWLSPVLKSEFHWFNKIDSSDAGEVQQKNPEIFASQLAKVFAECSRVLKDDGVLAFSFHHSKPEGWAAIYVAIVSAGLQIVNTHPVYAELRAASPKSAAKNPITIDSIIVCKKRDQISTKGSILEIDKSIAAYADSFASAGIVLGDSDRFVIKSSLRICHFSQDALNYSEICTRLKA